MSKVIYRNIISVFTSIVLLNQIQCFSSYYLSNLDNYSTYEDVSYASKDVQAISRSTYLSTNITYQLTIKKQIQPNEEATVYLKETHSLLIDSLKITKDDKTLTPNEDYSIFPLISPSIIPNNYFEGYTEKVFDAASIYCSYINVIPSYHKFVLSKEAIKSIIHTKTMNFAIDINSNTMRSLIYQTDGKVAKFLLENIEYDLAPIYSSERSFYKDIHLKQYKHLFLLTTFYTLNQLFAALSIDNTLIYFFQVNPDNNKVLCLGICQIEKDDEIRQVGMKRDKIYLATKNGLRFGVRSNSKYVLDSTFTDNNKNLIDLIVNSNTVYVINDQGLHIFDIESDKYIIENYIKHPRLKKLDYVPYDINNTFGPYYIGIAVDNDPGQGYPEILIEIVLESTNELMPSLNKVYITNSDIKIEDMATDYELGFTYIFDRETSKLYILKRAIPFIENTFSYSIDLSQEFSFTKPSPSDANRDYLAMIANINDPKNKNQIVIMDKNGIVIFDNLNIIPQAFSCQFKEKANYNLLISVDRDCSFYNTGSKKFIFQACKTNYIINYNVKSKFELVGIWIAVGIIAVLIIGVLVYLFFLRNYLNKKKTAKLVNTSIENNNKSKDDVKHKEIIEVEIDNRL